MFLVLFNGYFYKKEQTINDIEYISNNLNEIDFNSKQVIPWGVEVTKENIPSYNQTKIVKVAIIDSGIDKNHIELLDKVVLEFNAIKPNETIVDELGHGTAIAGIIAAIDNDIGIVGISPNVELYSVKVLDEYGYGDMKDFIDGIEWCIKNEVDIINISFGISKNIPELEEAVNKAINEGIIIVASAGNTYGGSIEYPAAYEKVISVSAIDEYGNIADFSANKNFDILAPGVDILTTGINGSYITEDGTSLATAHITGLISIFLQSPEKFNLKEAEDIHTVVLELVKKFKD